MRGLLHLSVMGPLLACAGAAAFVTAVPAAAQGSYSPYNETAAAALARYVRALADDPKDFNALIGAGRAALELGDTQAAAGFFARADAVNPQSPAPQAGMGAVQVANGNPNGAMPYFARAQQLGATQAMLGCNRGLAYDLLGQQALAQADYRAALAGADREEVRRRLALSLAISGDKQGALAVLAPLAAKGDATTNRVRAFVLALTGDANAARMAIDAAMPGTWSRVAPFLQRLPTLPAGEKAAAVNLGIFPDSNQPAYAYAAPVSAVPSTMQNAGTVDTDRIEGVDELLRGSPTAAAPQPVWQQPTLQQAQPVQVAYATPPRPATVQRTQAVAKPKIWLQLASGQNTGALSQDFDRMKSHHEAVFKGITGYLVQESDRARLIIGPFRGATDAEILADDLHTLGIDAFRWTNSSSDRIVPIAGE